MPPLNSQRSIDKRIEREAIREWYRSHSPDARQIAGQMPFHTAVTLDGYVMARQIVVQLAQYRKNLGLSLADVSSRTGIDERTLEHLESGELANPSIDLLVRYAIGLGKRLKLTL